MGLSFRAAASLAVLSLGCATAVEDGVFSSASASASVSVGSSADDVHESDTDRAGTSSGGVDPMDTGADGVTGPVDDDGAASSSGADDDTGDPTIGPLEDSGGGSTGPLDPTNDPTLDDGGGLPAGDCCTPNGGLGCDDPAIEACVCMADDVCCTTGWDDICVDEAAQLCGAPCMGGGGGGDCCAVQAVPGCSDPALEACVCMFDDYCCTTEWDDVCVDEAIQLCGAPC